MDSLEQQLERKWTPWDEKREIDAGRSNPAAGPGPRGNPDIDEYDLLRALERIRSVSGH